MWLVYLVLALVIFVAGFVTGGSKVGKEMEADVQSFRNRAEAAEAKVKSFTQGVQASQSAAAPAAKSAS